MAQLAALRSESRQAALVDAALAVNDALTLDEALRTLVRTGLELLGSDDASVVVWDARLETGTLAAGAGEAQAYVGETIRPGRNGVFRAASERRVVVADASTCSLEGYSDALLAANRREACSVYVPFAESGEGPPLVLVASWREAPTHSELEDGVALLETLSRLTRIAYHAERERRSELERDRLAAVIDATPVGIWVFVPGREPLMNATARTLLAVPPGAHLDPAMLPVRTPDERPVDEQDWPSKQALSTGEPIDFRLRVPTFAGVERVFEGTAAPFPSEPAEKPGVVFAFRDVTAEYESEFVAAQLLGRGFDALPVAAALLEPRSSRIVRANRAYSDLVGYAADEILALEPPYPWWEPNGASLPFTSELGPAKLEALFRRRDGGLAPVEITSVPIPGADGSEALWLGVITDLSERRRFEQQLIQSGKLAALGELAAGVAHEVNNPLFAILGLVEFLLKDAEPGTKARERLELIHETGLEIKEIVRSLLDFAREPSDAFSTMLLRDVVAETVALVLRTSASKSVEIVERYSPDPIPVEGSPNQLKQVVLNLLTNAQQAMPDGGTVTLELVSEGERVALSVSDSGPGLPEEVLPRIFEPFYTTRRGTGGTGLGLAVSLGIAQLHGGTLEAANRPGGGAAFTLRLPVARPEDE